MPQILTFDTDGACTGYYRSMSQSNYDQFAHVVEVTERPEGSLRDIVLDGTTWRYLTDEEKAARELASIPLRSPEEKQFRLVCESLGFTEKPSMAQLVAKRIEMLQAATDVTALTKVILASDTLQDLVTVIRVHQGLSYEEIRWDDPR